MLQQIWYEEAWKSPHTVKYKGDSEFVIYKGVKLEKTNDGLKLLDVRFNDFYTKLPKKDKKLLKIHGFIKGCDHIMYRRDGIRCTKYKLKLEALYTDLKYYEKNINRRNKRAFIKKIGIVKKHIRENLDLFVFYSTRRDQFKVKYQLK